MFETLAADGPITFAELMGRVLYDPIEGYYPRGLASRDYATAPRTSPAFGHLVGRALARMWESIGRPPRFVALELGAGDGTLGRQAVGYLRAREAAAAEAIRYVTIDRAGARSGVGSPLAGVGAVVAEAGHLPTRPIVGCILSNELFDAMPVHRVVAEAGGLAELWVTRNGRRLTFERGVLSDARIETHLADSGVELAAGQIADVSLVAVEVLVEIAARLERGYVLTIDYGGTAHQIYGRHRMAGTLLAYHRHHAVDDPLARPGEQDLTAHVDFDALRRIGEASGLQTAAYLSQRDFLHGLGLRDWFGRLDPAVLSAADLFNAHRGAEELVDPRRLGKFRVLIQTRDAHTPTVLRGRRSDATFTQVVP